MRHRICIQGKYNALLLPPPSPFSVSPSSLSLPLFSLLSPFSSATKEGFVARRSPTKPYTHPPRSRRRLVELSECYKRVHARAIRQRCNAVPRTPLSSRRISCFVDFVSSIRPTRERKFKEDVSTVNALTPIGFPIMDVHLFLFRRN